MPISLLNKVIHNSLTVSRNVSDINECSPDPCQNGATCQDLVGSYRCDCKAGYSGNNCETGENNLRGLFISK